MTHTITNKAQQWLDDNFNPTFDPDPTHIDFDYIPADPIFWESPEFNEVIEPGWVFTDGSGLIWNRFEEIYTVDSRGLDHDYGYQHIPRTQAPTHDAANIEHAKWIWELSGHRFFSLF